MKIDELGLEEYLFMKPKKAKNKKRVPVEDIPFPQINTMPYIVQKPKKKVKERKACKPKKKGRKLTEEECKPYIRMDFEPVKKTMSENHRQIYDYHFKNFVKKLD